jgi:TFIIF-interacting CTD phosphatase-like protein
MSGIYITCAKFSVRPYTLECLQFANRYFEVGVFTAGKEWFANPIIDHIDPNKTLI